MPRTPTRPRRRSAPASAPGTSSFRRSCGPSTSRPARPTSWAASSPTRATASCSSCAGPSDPSGHVTRELREVFAERRVERVKRLLDDLQTRIDPAAVRIVKQHLERWQAAVGEREATCTTRADLEPLDSQAVTWFQLVSGDKEPEAYIDHEDRAKVRGAMLSRTVRSYACSRRCVDRRRAGAARPGRGRGARCPSLDVHSSSSPRSPRRSPARSACRSPRSLAR